ncbi:MAG: HEAT repeat domain-containing protein [Deltaproteobacteria bacterium]|nr:HEAT repeat domain-containing protein [Deltaproteobacteria bacterium]
MDATLKSLVQLVGATDVELRCAALLVLTQIEVVEDKVVKAVGEALASKNSVVRDFAVGYFERLRPRDGVRLLVPLLDSEEEGLRQRVVAILVEYGQPAVAATRKLAEGAPRRRLNAIIDLCSRVRTAAALDLLFELMASDDFDINRTACDALIAAVPSLDARARADLFARSETLAAQGKGQRTALVAAAKLFGALADPKARKRLFPLLETRQAHAVRTHALGALAACLRGHKLSTGEIDTLLGLLDSDDEAGILRPAIHLLDEQTLSRDYLSQLNRLAESQQPAVKRFAIQKLGGFESAAVVKTLIGYLTDDSYARRDQATASLKKLPAARKDLMKELIACDDERKAWTVADILLVHDRDWKRDTIDALWKRLQDGVENRDDRLYTAYLHFLNAIDADRLAERIRERGEAMRKKKAFAAAAKWLGLLKDTPAFDAETQFLLALADLKAHPRVLAAVVRRHDAALDSLRALLRSRFAVAERLRKERSLEADDLLYVGFQLAEGSVDEKASAQELLEHVAQKFGRTKAGKAAKNKLRLLAARR